MSTQLVTLDSNQLFSYHFSVFVVAFARGSVLALSMTSSVVEWICPFSGSLGNNQVFCCIRQPFKDWKETELGVSESSLQSQRIVRILAFCFSASCVSENSWLKKRMHHLRCNDGTTITVSPTSKTQTTPYQNPLVMRRTSTFKIVETNPTTESI